LEVARVPGALGTDRTFTRLSSACWRKQWYIHSNNLDTARRALFERVFYVRNTDGEFVRPPRPVAGIFKRLAPFGAAIARRCSDCPVWSYDSLIKSYAQQPAKMRRMADAVKSFGHKSLGESDAVVTMFVKVEPFSKDPSAYAPRAIQFRSPRYLSYVGRFLRPLEHRVYAAIARECGGPTVMKGFNALETAAVFREAWDRAHDMVYIGGDFSRYDQHCSPASLAYEHSVYKAVFPWAKGFHRALGWQLSNKGRGRFPDGTLRYEVEGCRMSGDLNTALGNCLVVCSMVHLFLTSLGIPVRFVNNGDDFGIFCRKKYAARVVSAAPAFFRSFGYTLEMEEPVDTFEQCEFCQTRPVFTSRGWIMTRSPERVCSRDWINKRPNLSDPIRDYKSWLTGVAECGLAIAGDVPVQGAMYRAMRRLSDTSTRHNATEAVTGMRYLAARLSEAGGEISVETRVSFWRAWGVLPEHQEMLEAVYDGLEFPTWRMEDRADLAASVIPDLL
jgi:hypothetical protein